MSRVHLTVPFTGSRPYTLSVSLVTTSVPLTESGWA